jgi:hypothetical protein
MDLFRLALSGLVIQVNLPESRSCAALGSRVLLSAAGGSEQRCTQHCASKAEAAQEPGRAPGHGPPRGSWRL